MPKDKVTRTNINNVRSNLLGDTPKYGDKAIKKAFIACARHYAKHGDKTLFSLFDGKLPNGVWKNRLHDFSIFVTSHDSRWVKENFGTIRKKLDEMSAIPGYEREKTRGE